MLVRKDLVFTSFREDMHSERTAQNGEVMMGTSGQLYSAGKYGEKSIEQFETNVKNAGRNRSCTNVWQWEMGGV